MLIIKSCKSLQKIKVNPLAERFIYEKMKKKNGKLYVGNSQDLARRLKFYYNINYLIKYSSMYIHRAL